MIRGATLVEIGEIHFHNIFEHIWFKWAFGIKCEKLWGCVLTHVNYFHVLYKMDV